MMSQAAASRAYTREFMIAMAAYVVAVFVTVRFTPDVDPVLRVPWVLIPLIPAGTASSRTLASPSSATSSSSR